MYVCRDRVGFDMQKDWQVRNDNKYSDILGVGTHHIVLQLLGFILQFVSLLDSVGEGVRPRSSVVHRSSGFSGFSETVACIQTKVCGKLPI